MFFTFSKGQGVEGVENTDLGVVVGRCGGGYNNLPRWTIDMYNVEYKPTKSQVFAQKICYIALNEWGFLIEALRRFPKECDARFRKMAIGRVRVFQRACERQKD